ncbi:MAG: ABC transporter permease, partial [Firmicutes bacterium]|nr:ABC transporter permease [Bacillota bacterium]
MRGFFWRMLKRLGIGLFMIFLVTSFTFVLIHLIPGNPVEAKYQSLLLRGLTPRQAQDMVQAMYDYIPKEPIWQQYLHYIWNVLHFNLGQSISYSGVPVSKLILQAMPWTVIMVLNGLLLSFVIGVL